MNRTQKIAWSLVVSMSLAMILGIMAFVVYRLNICSWRLFIYLAAGVQSIGAFSSFRFKPDKGAVTFDERDKLIEKNAQLAGLGAVFLIVILVSIIPPMIDANAKIPTTWFPFLLISVAFCYPFVMLVATLIQYGWKEKDHE
jgi:hypothetical protein